METTMINDGLLSDDDRYYLQENLELDEVVEGDPQAHLVYAVAHNVTELDSPVWTRNEAVSWVSSMADARGLRVKVIFRQQGDQYAYAGSRGGTIFLPADRDHPPYRSLKDGEYLACTVVHEFSHIVTVGQHWKAKIQSHGFEFWRCYLDILSTVMPTKRTEEAIAYLRERAQYAARKKLLTSLFRAFRKKGLVAIQNLHFDTSGAGARISEIVDAKVDMMVKKEIYKERIRGYNTVIKPASIDEDAVLKKVMSSVPGGVYYQSQDLMDFKGLNGAGIWLGYCGASDENTAKVAKLICDTIGEIGLTWEWDGNTDARIRVSLVATIPMSEVA